MLQVPLKLFGGWQARGTALEPLSWLAAGKQHGVHLHCKQITLGESLLQIHKHQGVFAVIKSPEASYKTNEFKQQLNGAERGQGREEQCLVPASWNSAWGCQQALRAQWCLRVVLVTLADIACLSYTEQSVCLGWWEQGAVSST